MPVIQAIQAVVGRTGGSGGPPPPPQQADFFWAGDSDTWLAFGGFYTNSTFSNPAPANPSYVYPDGSYTGKTRDFTGTEWMSSPNLGVGGAWSTTAISVNLWFYPTALGVQIMSESDVPGALNSYHYSMLEINSNGTVKAKFWAGTPMTSNNAVVLNQWNHIYFAEDTQGGHILEVNGVGTTGLPTYIRQGPGSTNEYFIIGDSDVTSMGNTGRFQGKIGYLQISDYVASSTYSSNWARFNLISTGQTLQSDWTIELIAELNSPFFIGWASLWGNESYDQAQGFFAYFNGPSSLNVGSPSGMDSYNVTGIETKGYWAFTHTSGGGIQMYRNGVLVNPNASAGSIQPTGGAGSWPLVIGSRHTNNGTGSTDPARGIYYWYNITTNTAKDATAILASYDAIKGSYGLP